MRATAVMPAKVLPNGLFMNFTACVFPPFFRQSIVHSSLGVAMVASFAIVLSFVLSDLGCPNECLASRLLVDTAPLLS
eukprot:scaffold189728_cov35-Prasinocladus_malaysianus.AAC.2